VLSVDPQPRGLPVGAAEGLALQLATTTTTRSSRSTATGTGTAIHTGGLFALVNIVVCAPMACAMFLGLAVEEKVSEYPAWTPKEAVSPMLDATLVLIKDEDGTGGDYLALQVHKAPGDT